MIWKKMNSGGCRESLATMVHPDEENAHAFRASTGQLLERFTVYSNT